MFRISHLRSVLGLLAFAALAVPAHAQDLFVTNNSKGTIERITPGGTTSTFASGLNGPTGLVFDSAGNLYVANNGNGVITKFAAGSSTGTTYFTQTGAAFQGLTIDSAGNLYASAVGTNSILKITAANTGTTYYTGTGTSALNAPNALVFDKSGTLYVGNTASTGTNADTISAITSSGTFSTFSTGIVVAYGLVFDGTGNLYAASGGTNNVLKYTTAGGTGAVFAIGLNNPHGAAFDSAGNLYVSNTSTPSIVKISSTGTVTTFDPSTDALLGSPRYLAFAPAPEPSPRTALFVGTAGLGVMALSARKRSAAK